MKLAILKRLKFDYINSFSKSNQNVIVNFKDRNTDKAVVGLLTKHCRLDRHLKLMGFTEKALYIFYHIKKK